MTSAFLQRATWPLAWVLALALLSACSPALNWRVVQPVAGLELLLPCKPSERKESVTMGEHSGELRMLGCRAQDLDFTHSMLALPEGVGPAELILKWQRASQLPLGPAQSQPTAPRTVLGVAMPAVGLRVQTSSGLQANLLWWSQGQWVHQAAVYGSIGDKGFDAAVDAYLSSIKQKD